ncbi:MAG: sugar ABC transporter permease [Chloroflexaceae bacterium]|jgi:multiple sugar transport system permease protein|nr:sugar ABC transporter permease [Chloroflexaceae bacterium]
MATTSPKMTGPSQQRRRSLATREALTGYLFIAPYLIVGGIFTYGLLFYVFGLSFTNLTAPFSRVAPQFVGLDNYVRAFSEPDFLRSLANVFWYFVVVTLFQTIGAILLAVLLNTRLRGIRFFRTLLYAPSVTSSVVIALIFFWLYQRFGIINYILGTEIAWLQEASHLFDPLWRTLGVQNPAYFVRGPSVAWMAIMVMNIFTTIPTFMVMFLAALQDVPGYVYEAAELDGATGWRSFWYITLPLLRPVVALVVILGTIGTFQVFDQAYVLTSGGPLQTTLTPSLLIFQKTLGRQTTPEAGFGAAMAFILAFIIVVITIIQRRYIEPATQQ